ncbi:MAG TPA: hypothetical protein VFM18_10265 [Methanosarcina sp.]|nr:hypothetical protein [Methanosarcina sp.]
MKKDANEFAHLIKAFKGAAEYMWTNFDHVMLSAIYSECIAIDEEIQRDINAQQNNVNLGEARKGSSNFSFANLEVSPITPEQQRKFDELVKKLEEQNRLENQKRLKDLE